MSSPTAGSGEGGREREEGATERLHSRPDPAAGHAHHPADWPRHSTRTCGLAASALLPTPFLAHESGIQGACQSPAFSPTPPFNPSPGADWSKGRLNRGGAGSSVFCVRARRLCEGLWGRRSVVVVVLPP